MSSRISIRGKAIGLGVAAAVTAGTIGLDATGALGDITPSGSTVGTTAALTREAPVGSAQVAAGRRHAEKKMKKRTHAARAAAAARKARAAASRSSVRSYSGDPRSIARRMAAARYGWGDGQFSCLNSLWQKESGWSYRAHNGSSGAYGIPQALPGSKMAAAGADWRTNPATQIEWGLSYIESTYGSPCAAWSTSRSRGWY